MSKTKHKELQAELQHLKTTRRREIAEALEYAKSLGDLSENAEYHEARADQAQIEERIAILEEVIKNVLIVDSHHSEAVEIGSTIFLQKEGDTTPKKFMIVGSEEANLAENKLSNESPLGSSLLGKRKGESASIKTPKGDISYKIIDIE